MRQERERERERERELRVRYREEREKIVKKLYAHAIVPMHICTGTVAICIYTQVCTGWYGRFFCSYRVKWAPFSILQNFTSTVVIALSIKCQTHHLTPVTRQSWLGWVVEKFKEIFLIVYLINIFILFIYLPIQRLIEESGKLFIDPLTKINIFFFYDLFIIHNTFFFFSFFF